MFLELDKGKEKLSGNKEDGKISVSLEDLEDLVGPPFSPPAGILTLMGDIWQTAAILR